MSIPIDVSKLWQVLDLTVEDFLIGMASLGKYQDINLVGAFEEPDDTTKRTAHRDIPLPFHRDGIYTQSIADLQGGMYIEKPDVDVVGMYCIRDNVVSETERIPCYTVLSEDEFGLKPITEVDLRPGQALIWDNRLWHGRHGDVGTRVLIRFWTTCPAVRERGHVHNFDRVLFPSNKLACTICDEVES